MPPQTTQRAIAPQESLPAMARLTGEVVYMYAFDVAYEMVRRPVPQLLGQSVAEFMVGASKRSPRQLLFSDHRWSDCRRWSASARGGRYASSAR